MDKDVYLKLICAYVYGYTLLLFRSLNYACINLPQEIYSRKQIRALLRLQYNKYDLPP